MENSSLQQKNARKKEIAAKRSNPLEIVLKKDVIFDVLFLCPKE
jgi:hypothetical protein